MKCPVQAFVAFAMFIGGCAMKSGPVSVRNFDTFHHRTEGGARKLILGKLKEGKCRKGQSQKSKVGVPNAASGFQTPGLILWAVGSAVPITDAGRPWCPVRWRRAPARRGLRWTRPSP